MLPCAVRSVFFGSQTWFVFLSPIPVAMHLLYLDDSGSISDTQDRYVVLAGFCVNEKQTHWIDKSMNELVSPFAANSVYKWEFHGTNMRGKGKQEWRRISYEDRKRVFLAALSIVTEKNLRLFAAVIDKKSCVESDNLTKMLLEQATSRFDLFLSRINRKQGARKLKEKGILIVDKAQKELEMQRLTLEFKHAGHTWGKLKNMAEVPLFLDSKSSRLIQLADLIAFAVYRNFQHGDTMYYNIIRDNFDCDHGNCHGLWIKQ